MARRIGQGDLLAGGAAAAVLVLAVALGLTPWLAIALAVATYAGAVLLRPRRGRQDDTAAEVVRQQIAYEKALAHTAAIPVLAPRIAKPAVRDRVGRIADGIDRDMAAMREDRNLTAAPLLNDRLLAPLETLLTDHVRLSTRGIKSAAAVLDRIESRDLPLIEQAVGAFYETLHRASVVDLAALSDVLEFGLAGIAATTPRRVTP